MTAYGTQSIVFIDSRVPDLQGLLDGLQPDEQAFVLDPSSDGVQQIADVLAANNFADLSSIAIVSHGESGTLDLGSSVITDANLNVHSSALAEIGASLAPGGTIKLYGCDVAQGYLISQPREPALLATWKQGFRAEWPKLVGDQPLALWSDVEADALSER